MAVSKTRRAESDAASRRQGQNRASRQAQTRASNSRLQTTMAAKTARISDSTSKEASSLPGIVLNAVLRYGKTDAFNYRADGEWYPISAQAFVERVTNVALGLAAAGIRPGDRIALLSENRPERSIADLALLSLGAINVPIYTTQAIEQIDYILSDSGAKAIFISNARLYKHAQPALAKRAMDHLIFFEPEVAEIVERGT